jgi:putative hydrolase of the HAD superfamily
VSPIRAVICDLDGVIRQWPEAELAPIERAAGLPPGSLLGAAFEPALLDRAIRGTISDANWRREITAALMRQHGAAADRAVAAWSELTGTVDGEMLELVAELRVAVPVVLLTNATTRLDADLRAAGLGDRFDAVVNSSALGAVKPEAAAFERAAELAGAAVPECALVDDQPAHVDAARTLGMAAVLHRNAVETRRELRTLGVPLAGGPLRSG